MSAAIAASAIPNIFGGFAPFPNTIATALLAYQSEAIGYGFGIKFQAGKRTIGAFTNEKFNGLTEASLGAIISKHNDELIGRMKTEMPKWIEIQQHYIEAGVTVEVMKANRTPSAWAEIIQSFTSAAGKQIVASIDGLSIEARSSILAISPILALIYYLSQTGTSTPPPPDDPTIPTGEFACFGITYTALINQPTGPTSLFLAVPFDYTQETRTYSCASIKIRIDELGSKINSYTNLPIVREDGTYAGTQTQIQDIISQSKEIEELKWLLQCQADNC